MPACVRCGCDANAGDDAHRIVAALVVDDLDGAIEAGLLDDVECSQCAPQCREALVHARAERQNALAARAPAEASKQSLPPAAAAALARAKARAAERKP